MYLSSTVAWCLIVLSSYPSRGTATYGTVLLHQIATHDIGRAITVHPRRSFFLGVTCICTPIQVRAVYSELSTHVFRVWSRVCDLSVGGEQSMHARSVRYQCTGQVFGERKQEQKQSEEGEWALGTVSRSHASYVGPQGEPLAFAMLANGNAARAAQLLACRPRASCLV